MTFWEATLFKPIQHKSIFKTQFEVILQRAFKVQLRFGLVPQCYPLGMIRGHVATHLYGIAGFDSSIIPFLGHVDTRGIIESRMRQAENETTAWF